MRVSSFESGSPPVSTENFSSEHPVSSVSAARIAAASNGRIRIPFIMSCTVLCREGRPQSAPPLTKIRISEGNVKFICALPSGSIFGAARERISRGQCQIYLRIAEREYLRRSQRTNKPRAMSNLFAHRRAGVSSAEPKRRLSAGSRNFRAGIAATGRMSGTPVFRRFLPFPLAGLD